MCGSRAADPADPQHWASLRFLSTVAERGLGFVGPVTVLVEVSCALARRAREPAVGIAWGELVRQAPNADLVPVEGDVVRAAVDHGTRLMLRAGDACYVAVAEQPGTTLITWDRELLARAGGQTPTNWVQRS